MIPQKNLCLNEASALQSLMPSGSGFEVGERDINSQGFWRVARGVMNIADMGTPTLVANNLLGFVLPNRVCPEAGEVEIVVPQVRQLSPEFTGPYVAVVVDDAEGFACRAGHGPRC
jgi:hypothetical protein